MQHSLPPIQQKARNGWGTAFQNFWAGSITSLSLCLYGVATMAMELAAVVEVICESNWPVVEVSKV